MNNQQAASKAVGARKPEESSAALVRELQDLINQLESPGIQGRQRERFPISFRLALTPLDERGNLIEESTVSVIGKNISTNGISFSHEEPLTTKLIQISLLDTRVGKFAVEAETIWTRLTPMGLYESGCRLIRKIAGHSLRMGN